MIRASSAVLKTLFPTAHIHQLDDVIHFTGVVTDTRKSCSGALFIAITGEHFDGHDYVATAFAKGARIALVSRLVACAIPQVVVDDTVKAYGLLAHYWRQHVNPEVIAITGSNGKTTVKEMLHSILKREFNVLATKGNFNNEIGVPQTLCELSEDNDMAIIEMGANHADEIKRLSAIAAPDVVYVNNASATHIEGFGSLQGVRLAKGELYRYARRDAVALVNLDDEAATQWIQTSATQHIVTLSLSDSQADIYAHSKGDELSITTPDETYDVTLRVKGKHNHSNALAASGLALAVHASVGSIVQALSEFTGFKGRLQFLKGINGSTLIDDSYNANPTSFKAGINVLCALPGEAWLAMGDMAELGESAQQDHDNVVDFARHAGVKALFTKGQMSNHAAQKMLDKATTFESFDVMSDAIKGRINEHVNLLIKGSRSAQMDKLVDLLKGSAD